MSFLDDIIQSGQDVANDIGVSDIYSNVVDGVEAAAGTLIGGQVANATTTAVSAAQVAAQGQPAPANPSIVTPTVKTAAKVATPFLLVGALAAVYFFFFRKKG